MRAINRPNRDNAQSMAFAWIDTKEVRSPETRAYAILNDTESNVSENVLDTMRNYGVNPIPWSHRQDSMDELAA